jgi:hypothetical protein
MKVTTTIEIIAIIKDAISNPDGFAKGAKRRQLQSAVDLCLNSVSVLLLGQEFCGAINLRRSLNQLNREDVPRGHLEILDAVSSVLREYELLNAKKYNDTDGNIIKFCGDHLANLYQHLTYERN